PPYIASDVIPQLAVTVRGYEPHVALDGGNRGLEIIERLVQEARNVLAPGGHFLCEIGYDQGKSVLELVEQAGGYGAVTVMPDQAGLPRLLKAVRR
ncbi:MAG TPA: hypothetical protein PKD72_10220, partial [Gemmatales bacterium]|nr:hypothetical protein [Gemmatales bacterium]